MIIKPVLTSSILVSAFLLASCASPLKVENAEQLKKNTEFDQAVQIVKPATPEEEVQIEKKLEEAPKAASTKGKKTSSKKTTVKAPSAKPAASSAATNVSSSKKSATTNTSKKSEAPAAAAVAARQPDLEDSEGFNGRRPVVDPFRVGEEVVHDVNYFKVSAGELRMKVEPFSIVNNRKSYTFAIEIKTSPLFSRFYSVEDRVETFVDYEDLVPRVFQLHVKESDQVREAKMLFNTETDKATFWEKKVTKKDGEEEKKEEWEILPYTQNVYSAVFYMRNFKWDTGKEYSFRVANDKENLVFSGKAIRREVLQTKLGPMKAIVIQPNIVLKGKFKPIGDNFIWLSDDDRRYILRIESKIKIGTLVSEVIAINPGKQ